MQALLTEFLKLLLKEEKHNSVLLIFKSWTQKGNPQVYQILYNFEDQNKPTNFSWS